MHRLIVTSTTYRQSSDFNEAVRRRRTPGTGCCGVPAAAAGRRSDPRCQLCCLGTAESEGGRPQRLARTARRHARSARRLEGLDAGGAQSPQRLHFRPPQHALSDAAKRSTCRIRTNPAARRNTTITAPQALSLLNGKVSLEWAQAFAGRVIREAGRELR